jgi:hypothetical protein
MLLVFLLFPGIHAFGRSYSLFLPADTAKTTKPVVKPKHRVRFTMPSDSVSDIDVLTKEGKKKKKFKAKNDTLKFDSLKLKKAVFNPSPLKATWLAMIFPGAGQIYNRKFWKLPIVYGGLAGCAYALSWNNNMYKDYAQGYRDLLDDNTNTNSYKKLIPSYTNYSTTQLTSILKNRKDLYRRYRDLSIFALIGVYVISIIDAYVDAELSNFDISPDLSMKIEPVIMNNKNIASPDRRAYGVQCSLKF